jgi:type VI protein secretion system component VasF
MGNARTFKELSSRTDSREETITQAKRISQNHRRGDWLIMGVLVTTICTLVLFVDGMRIAKLEHTISIQEVILKSPQKNAAFFKCEHCNLYNLNAKADTTK